MAVVTEAVEVMEDEQSLELPVVKSAIMAIADQIFQSGLFRLEKSARVDGFVKYLVAVGVVSPKHVATLEERDKASALRAIDLLVALASQEIRHWNSYHTGYGGDIPKDLAVNSIALAASILLNEQS